MSSPFSAIPPEDRLAETASAFAIWDGHPVSSGHVLVVPKRECRDWFDATQQERLEMLEMLELVELVKPIISARCGQPPDGWNVGFNAGAAAGQTVFHCHVHVIPRWHGDVPDPRGGVRNVIPSKGNYRASGHASSGFSAGAPDTPLLPLLQAELSGATRADILSSFIQASGITLLSKLAPDRRDLPRSA